MNNNTTQSQDMQMDNNSQQPNFQWETPVLYTENWLKTMTGQDGDAVEVDDYYTGI